MTKKTFQDLFHDLYPSLCLFANKYLNNKAEAEDIAQESFVELWKQKSKFETVSHIKSFLYLSIKNKCINALKHNKVKNKYIGSLSLDHVSFFEEQVIKTEVIHEINKAVNNLSKQRKEIILLAMQGLKNVEIAEELDISINTVKLQKKIAYKLLREKLGKTVFLILF